MSPCKTWLLHFSTLKELRALLLCTPAAKSWKKTSRLAAFHHITVKFFMRRAKLPQPKPFLWPSDDKVAILSAGHAIKPNITKETTIILKQQMTPWKTWPTAVKQKCWDHTLYWKKQKQKQKTFRWNTCCNIQTWLQRRRGEKTPRSVLISGCFPSRSTRDMQQSNRQLSSPESMTWIIDAEGGDLCDDEDVDPQRYAQWGDSLRCAHWGGIRPAVLSTHQGNPGAGHHHYFMFYGF